ncbi:MAG: serine hydrolase [Pseudomonadota bacterium]
MRHLWSCLALCGLASSISLPQAAAAQDESLGAALASLDTELEKIRTDWQVPGVAIAITKGDKIVYARGFGLRDVAHNLPMTADTLLAIGSTTKAFTTAVMAVQVEEGKLDWNEPVRRYLPTFKLKDPVASERTTALDLITHRTGLPGHDALWYNADFPRAELVRRMQFLEPSKDFRAELQYNNIAYAAAGHLLEVVSGKSWEENVRSKLFQPLGMKRANFSVTQMQSDANFSQPYRQQDDGKMTQIPFRDISIVGPAGSINASVNEMAAWTILQLNHGQYQGRQILSEKSINFLHTPRMAAGLSSIPEIIPVGYAAGWGVTAYRGHLRLQHHGAIDGFSSSVTLLPNAGIGITILTNQEQHVPELLERTTIDRLLALTPRDWSGERMKKSGHAMMDGMGMGNASGSPKSDTRPSHPLAAYAGVYGHPAYGELRVSFQDGKLSYELNRIETPLAHWHFDTFNSLKAKDSANENRKLRFSTDESGDISSLFIQFEPAVEPIVFDRKGASTR